jgi:hypothetical protein
MKDANYCVTGGLSAGGLPSIDCIGITASGFQFVTRNGAGAPTDYFRVFFDVKGELS